MSSEARSRSPSNLVGSSGRLRPTCRICLMTRDQSQSPLPEGKKGPSHPIWSHYIKAHLPAAILNIIEDIRALLESLLHPDLSWGTSGAKTLIAPCKCRGTMKYVHRGCLDIWRTQSSRRDSYYKCEQCFNEYKFQETTVSLLLSNKTIIKSVAGAVFWLWLYGWFVFVKIGLGMTETSDAFFYIDVNDMYAVGMDNGMFYHIYLDEPTAPSSLTLPTGNADTTNPQATDNHNQNYTTTSPTIAPTNSAHIAVNDQDQRGFEGDNGGFGTKSLNLIVKGLVPPSLKAWMDHNYFQLLYTFIIVVMFDFVIVNPSVILAANLLFFIWRAFRFEYLVDFILLSFFLGFGLGRTLITIYDSMNLLLQRYIKLRCIEIQDLQNEETRSASPNT